MLEEEIESGRQWWASPDMGQPLFEILNKQKGQIMALKITAQDINKRWKLGMNPGDDPWTALFGILAIQDAKIDSLSKSIERLGKTIVPELGEAAPEGRD